MFYYIMTGSRKYPTDEQHRSFIQGRIQAAYQAALAHETALTVVSGHSANGLDTIVRKWTEQFLPAIAQNPNIHYRGFPCTPEMWKTYGKVAGLLRNQQMITEICNEVAVSGGTIHGAAFYSTEGPGKGTPHCHGFMLSQSIPVRYYLGMQYHEGWTPEAPKRVEHPQLQQFHKDMLKSVIAL